MTSHSVRNAVEILAEEFVERYREGERPPLSEYTKRYPEHAEEIRDLFPALLVMENLKLGEEVPPCVASEEPALKQIGDYRILREAGRGGMGIVYEAEQLSLGRRVAVKVLPQHVLINDVHKRRFEREAKAAAKLHHTNIVPVFGVGEQNGMHYYVMQYIQGLGLEEIIDELCQMEIDSLGNTTPAQKVPFTRVKENGLSATKVARSLISGQLSLTISTNTDDDGLVESDGTSPSSEGALDADSDEKQFAETVRTTCASGGRTGEFVSLSEPMSVTGHSDRSGVGSTSRTDRKRNFWNNVANIGRQVASALNYAHEQGITHRDIKPSNLLLDMQGTVWVTDFGLAKAKDEDDITHTGDILGTVRYMPPEAFEGRSDARGDQYSLGLTLYELLGHKPAYDERDRNQLIKLVTTTEPMRIEKLIRDVPRDLATIIHKAIERDPAHRYATVGEMAADLERFLEDEPIRARKIPLSERIVLWSRRNRGLAASLSAVCLLFLIINVAGPLVTWRMSRLNTILKDKQTKLLVSEFTLRDTVGELQAREHELQQQTKRAQDEERRANLEAAREQAARKLTRRAVYSSVLFAAQHAISTPKSYSRAVDLLDELRPQAGETDMRGWEWYYLHAKSLPGELVLEDFSADPVCAVFSPDGTHLATSGGSGNVKLFASNSGHLVETFRGHVGTVRSLAWSPDGSRIASAGYDKTTRIWNIESGSMELSFFASKGRVEDVAWSPNGMSLVTGGSDGMVGVWDAVSGNNLATLAGHEGDVRGVDWSPDGRQLVSGGMDKTIRLWNAATGEQIDALSGLTAEVSRVQFSPDGRRIAAGNAMTMEGAAVIWDLERPTSIGRLSISTRRLTGSIGIPQARYWPVVVVKRFSISGRPRPARGDRPSTPLTVVT